VITFQINNSYTYCQGTLEELEIVKQTCSHPIKRFVSVYQDDYGNRIRSAQYKKLPPSQKSQYHLETEHVIQIYSYYHDTYNSIPTGWMSTVLKNLKDIQFNIQDKRNKPTLMPISDSLPTLRDYQLVAIEKALKSERGIIKHPTGSGKTFLICRILSSLGLTSMIMVPNLILLDQTIGVFSEYLDENLIGKIGDGDWNIKKFTVATPQTLWSRREKTETKLFLDSINLFICDEAHKINKSEEYKFNTNYSILMKCRNAFYRYGMTATPGKPETLQRKLLEASTGPVIDDIEVQKLIDQGYLTDAKIMIKKIDIAGNFKNWRQAYEDGILNNENRNKAIKMFAEYYAKQGKSVLIIVDEIEQHADKFGFDNWGTLTGLTKRNERQLIIEEFKNKNTKIMVSTVLSEGFDFRGLDVVIMAAGKKSDKKTCQRIGRALRKEVGKQEAVIIDFYDGGKYLKKHSDMRIETYKELGFKLEFI